MPVVPWKQVVAIRNTFIHTYFGIDAEIVWSVGVDKVGPLSRAVRRYLGTHDSRP